MKISGMCAVIAGVLVAVICSSAPRAAAQEPLVACVKPGSSMLRILPPGESCKPQETPLTFNDFPLLVVLRATVEQLQEQVQLLEERVALLEACVTSTIPACTEE